MKGIVRPLLALGLICCGGSQDDATDAGPDVPLRTCGGGVTWTVPNQPPCTWEWSCEDHLGRLDQYSASCKAVSENDVECECREEGRVAGTFTIEDGCISFVSTCEAANAGCSFATPIDCPE